ncbi:MAG: tRNA (guanosine(46)-N7)-methyltransferase TrmB [Deltaproteobacteria bacterium]|nr:tRNA (guanosine(46)-N7)-methyltransferase TrmB [Deltaproteobacteria bacterium]MBN2673690.1 tRNA (guanosine(46)-N7)-methyltransferase TrmB [Deltaproteobacteria bacterium]
MTDRDSSTYTHDDNPYLQVSSFQGTTGPVFPREILGDGNLELEIGFGRGQFIRERATNADVRILGIETKRKLVYLCDQKAKQQQLDNLVVMHGDAREVIARMTPDGVFQSVFIHFPDPWWKARHQKRKVVTDSVTEDIVRLLAPGGHYFVQTDVDFRADEYLKILQAHPNLIPVEGDGMASENTFLARSSRERRAMDLGMPVYRILFQKK